VLRCFATWTDYGQPDPSQQAPYTALGGIALLYKYLPAPTLDTSHLVRAPEKR